jgi:hypothetical protein
MITSIVFGMVILAFALWDAARRLGEALQEAVEGAIEKLRETRSDELAKANLGHRSRMSPAEAGTRLVYVDETRNELEIVYAPVLAFVEGEGGNFWCPLALLKDDPYARIYSGSTVPLYKVHNARVLLPGESLSDHECSEMMKRYREEVELDRQLARQGADDADS